MASFFGRWWRSNFRRFDENDWEIQLDSCSALPVWSFRLISSGAAVWTTTQKQHRLYVWFSYYMFDYELAFSSKRFKFLFECEIKLGATCLSFSTRMFEQKEKLYTLWGEIDRSQEEQFCPQRVRCDGSVIWALYETLHEIRRYAGDPKQYGFD